jgi:DNA helicase-2/ATP-dependent DNA helicase PcrA
MQFDLNASQKTAVETDSKQCVIFAGPGTGKTRVISLRVKYLIETKKIKGANIMALTFTKKAVIFSV